jgi:DNA polymerase
MRFMSIDIETYSDIDINKSGVYRYVDTDEFKILLFAYSVDGGPVQLIDLTRGDSIPKEIVNALSDKSVTKWAYNANFERVALSRFLGMPTGQYLDPESWKCSMVWAATLGLPMGLAKVGEVLALDKQKMSEGRGLIYKFCKPDKKTGQRVLPEEFPEDWETFRRYNIRDVETEMGIQKMISPFPCSDELWQEYWTDQRINDRGVEVDLTLARNAVSMDAEISKKLMEKMRSLTGIDNPRSTSQLDMWLREHGCDMVSLGKKDVAQVIEETDDPLIRKVLSLRLLIAKSSVKKYTKMLDATCSDGRARGMFQFYGAMRTGRFAGRLLQLQNLPQNHIENIGLVRALARRGDLDALSVMFDSVPDILSQLIRTAFVAREGSRFIVADFSAIEARVIAWLAGEEWRMKAFAEGKDIYCASASAMFGVPVVKHGINGELRQKGKVAELACGYGGSVGALKAFGADKMGLTETEMQSIVDNWRASSPRIVQLWWNVDRAIKQTLEDGTTHRTHGLMFSLQKGILFIRLPSGRSLAYVKPRLIDGKITYEGVSSNKGWARLESYGPKFVENITQAISRDLLLNAMKQVGPDARICMHIHDELVIEADSSVKLDDICKKMAQVPEWAEGLLLRADGYETKFYLKD